MAKKVYFLIGGRLSSAFAAEVSAFARALGRLKWSRWRPFMLVCVDGDPDDANGRVCQDLRRNCCDLTVAFAPRRGRESGEFGYLDALFRLAPRDADAIVKAEPDTLPVGDLESILDLVVQNSAIAGVIAHNCFPRREGVGNREAWLACAEGLIGGPLRFDYVYSLADPAAAESERATPFYVGDGFVYFSARYFSQLAPRFVQIRPEVAKRLEDPGFAGQVALALAAAEIALPAVALPMRFNCPNDDTAFNRFPGEFADVRVFHYLRSDEFDPNKIFLNSDNYLQFLSADLSRANSQFRSRVSEVFGPQLSIDAKDGREVPPEAASEAVETADLFPSFATEAELLNRGALEPLMFGKRALVAKLGVREGFAKYKQLLSIPESIGVNRRALAGLGAYARRRGLAFRETSEGGRPFHVKATRIVGEGQCSDFEGLSRATFVACLQAAAVRGSSSIIEVGPYALLDFEDEERDLFDYDVDIDAAVFHGDRRAAWIISAEQDPDRLEVREAFTLLGTHFGSFGDFMRDYLPNYIAADMSGALPPVPILIGERAPPTVLEAMRLAAREGVEIVTVGHMQPVRVERLWCGSNLAYAPAREIRNERYSFDHLFRSPEVMAPVVRELRRRFEPHLSVHARAERVYLARRSDLWRKASNSREIEEIVAARGFKIVYPESLPFIAQASLLANARHVVMPEGSAGCLTYFAKPGTKVCLLTHPITEGMNLYESIFVGVEFVAFTGPIERFDSAFPDRSDYRIDPRAFAEFLDPWLNGA